MPKRPRSHEIEDISRRRLRDIFGTCGWVVWDLYPDYGEDFLVRIFTDAIATHYSFFVQAKGTDTIDRYVRESGKYLYFPIDVDHLEHWDKFWEPVILTIWDAKADITYWEIIQDSLQGKPVASLKRKTMSIRVPMGNVLNEHGLQEIVVRTKRRFRRFEKLSSGVQVLIGLIEERLGVQVEYNFEDDLFRIHDPTGFTDWFYFDELAQLTADYTAKTGRDPGQFALAAMLQGVLDNQDQPEIKVFLRYNGKVVIFYKDEIVCYHDTLEEFMKNSFHKVIELRDKVLGKHDN